MRGGTSFASRLQPGPPPGRGPNLFPQAHDGERALPGPKAEEAPQADADGGASHRTRAAQREKTVRAIRRRVLA